ncbi:sigma-54-dependent Fis family transcriptional regulator [Pseudoalteromonas sp. J010]|uniref:sigma-54-dependent transcriptional regulator n=1 Tax=Pseudoalteromonas sp. J010 TaxID=998465 RepID=UPI000F649307|nr:sigma-54 dependent transcriptional regulator [Pseudoalteromonas sp. J010]RRS10639.1 sigma-54-dependent Fis family transcriptional regulator [Pseudoalteromonas sp. J010]
MEPIHNITLLFVDDEPLILRSLIRALRDEPYEVLTANSGEEGLALLEERPIDVVISDKMMPNMSGIEFLGEVAERYPDTLRIMLTAFTDLDGLIHAINQGKVWGYLQKPFEIDSIKLTIEQALQTKMLIAERNMLRSSLARYKSEYRTGFHRFVGDSIAMQTVYRAIEKAGPSRANVFITGPSGTGKELAAEAIHHSSERSNKPFICLNCAAIPKDLMESEIFGHIKGAFSGAIANRDGAASEADGGTLFLDELGEMDIALQAKILRFVQTGTFQKVGSAKTEKVDVRFVCATNRDPYQAIAENHLREDLYYRLNVISIDLPPLHDRGRDVLLLAQHFLQRFSELENKIFVGFSDRAEQLILQFDWPGNVRQLENFVHSIVVMSDGPLIDYDVVQAHLPGDTPAPLVTKTELNPKAADIPPIGQDSTSIQKESKNVAPLAEVERVAIEQALLLCDDNVVKAASLLEVSPSTLYRKIQQWSEATS